MNHYELIIFGLILYIIYQGGGGIEGVMATIGCFFVATASWWLDRIVPPFERWVMERFTSHADPPDL